MEKNFEPYESCPIIEDGDFMLRLVSPMDAEDLMNCYSLENEGVKTNAFNCTFGYNVMAIDDVKNSIAAWLNCFKNKEFIRWSIIDKKSNKAIGTIELFNRIANDYFNNCGILRIDLQTDKECFKTVHSLLDILFPKAFDWFGFDFVATKVSEKSTERLKALGSFGFSPSDKQILGSSGEIYNGFWILKK